MEYMHVPVKLPSIYDILGAFALLFIILVLACSWKTWKAGKRYAHLPSYRNLVFEEAYKLLTNKTNLQQLTSVIFQKLDDIAKLFEKEGMVHIWCFRHILVIYGEEAMKVFASEEASSDKSPDYVLLNESLGVGLIASNGGTWKKDRKLMNPAFHIGCLKGKLPILNENAKILVKKLTKFANKPIADLLQCLESCAFHNLCEAILDINSTDVGSDAEIERMYKVITAVQKYMAARWVLSPILAILHQLLTPLGWKISKLTKEGKQFGLKVISPSLESFSCNSRDSEKDLDENRKPLLHILLERQIKDPSVTSTYVLDHANTLLSAGSDTVVLTMMWCLFLLGLNKDVQQKAFDEIQSIADEFVTYENLCQLEYLECIIKETLRLYPILPIFARQLKRDIQCGKYTVPKDTTIVFFLYRLHRNPEIYPDPEKFDPDRFLSTNAKKRNWAHLPFSEGYRSCIGKKFAMMEAKVILAHILRNYEITSLDRREDLVLKWNFVLLPTKLWRMRITRREIISQAPCITKE